MQHILLNESQVGVHGVLFNGSMRPVEDSKRSTSCYLNLMCFFVFFCSRMYFYCQFAGQSAVETFHLISSGLSEVKTVFLLLHTPIMGFSAEETHNLFRGSRRYLNRHSGPRMKID